MYVCLCVGLTKDEIAQAVRAGDNTMDLLMDNLGVSLGCALCREEVESILMEANQCNYGKESSELFPILKHF